MVAGNIGEDTKAAGLLQRAAVKSAVESACCGRKNGGGKSVVVLSLSPREYKTVSLAILLDGDSTTKATTTVVVVVEQQMATDVRKILARRSIMMDKVCCVCARVFWYFTSRLFWRVFISRSV